MRAGARTDTAADSSGQAWREDVIRWLADDEAEQVAGHVDARRDADAWRLIARTALQKLHERTREIERLRDQHHRLQDDYRRLRATILRNDRRTA